MATDPEFEQFLRSLIHESTEPPPGPGDLLRPGEQLTEETVGRTYSLEAYAKRKLSELNPAPTGDDIEAATAKFFCGNSGDVWAREEDDPTLKDLGEWTPYVKGLVAVRYARLLLWQGRRSLNMEAGIAIEKAAEEIRRHEAVRTAYSERQRNNVNVRHEESREEKKRYRKKAQALWKEDPELTIADVIKTLDRICKPSVEDRQLRSWIKDLCPNRRPGRRPTKKN